jgi:hypothetical protein
MSDHTFAPWVAPGAAELRETRAEVVSVARQLPLERWDQPSPLEGWAYRDLLAHLATGDWVFQTVLSAVTKDRDANLSFINPDFVNAGNAERVAGRRTRPIEDVIAEVAQEGEETQALLARLTPEDESYERPGLPMTLVEGLRRFPGHDRDHVAQLRTALES